MCRSKCDARTLTCGGVPDDVSSPRTVPLALAPISAAGWRSSRRMSRIVGTKRDCFPGHRRGPTIVAPPCGSRTTRFSIDITHQHRRILYQACGKSRVASVGPDDGQRHSIWLDARMPSRHGTCSARLAPAPIVRWTASPTRRPRSAPSVPIEIYIGERIAAAPRCRRCRLESDSGCARVSVRRVSWTLDAGTGYRACDRLSVGSRNAAPRAKRWACFLTSCCSRAI